MKNRLPAAGGAALTAVAVPYAYMRLLTSGIVKPVEKSGTAQRVMVSVDPECVNGEKAEKIIREVEGIKEKIENIMIE